MRLDNKGKPGASHTLFQTLGARWGAKGGSFLFLLTFLIFLPFWELCHHMVGWRGGI